MVRYCASAASTRSGQALASDTSAGASKGASTGASAGPVGASGAPASVAMGPPTSGLVPRESVAASDGFWFPSEDVFPHAAGPRTAASDTSEERPIVHPGDGKERMLMADRAKATSGPRIVPLNRLRTMANVRPRPPSGARALQASRRPRPPWAGPYHARDGAEQGASNASPLIRPARVVHRSATAVHPLATAVHRR